MTGPGRPARAVVTGLLGGRRRTGQLLAAAAVTRLSPAASPLGLVLGQDNQGSPVVVRLFRAEPTRVVLVGGHWIGSLLAFRAFALGARPVAPAATALRWQQLGRASGCPPEDLMLLDGAAGDPAPAGPSRPVLWISEPRSADPAAFPPREPRGWETVLTLLPDLTGPDAAGLQATDLVLLQRLSAADAATVTSVRRLAASTAEHLQRLDDDMLAVVGGGADRYVWIDATPTEVALLGPVWRR